MMDLAIIAEPVDIALCSSEKGGVVQPVKPRKKTMTSMFLKYFDTAADGKSRKCKMIIEDGLRTLCNFFSYSISTATGIFYSFFFIFNSFFLLLLHHLHNVITDLLFHILSF